MPTTVSPPSRNKSAAALHAEKHFSQYDVFWLRNDRPENRMVVNFCFSLEKSVDINAVNKYMNNWTNMFPRFRSQVLRKSLSTADWVPVANFDSLSMGCLAEHRLKKVTQEELDAYIDQCVNDALPNDTFQWKMVKVDNVPWGGCLLIWRLHHCVCDGLALVEMIRSLFEFEDPRSLAEHMEEDARRRQAYRRSRTLTYRLRKLGRLVAPVAVGLAIGYGLSLGLVNSFVLGVSLLVVIMWGRPLVQTFRAISGWRNPESKSILKSAIGGVKHTKTLHGFTTVSEVKAMANAYNTRESRYTVNDVLCAMIGGAFRRYFTEQGHKANDMVLRCVVPVSIRGPREQFRCENRFTLVFANLPVHLEHLKERMEYMHSVMDDLKQGLEPLVGIVFIKLISCLPESIMHKVVDYYCKHASMVVTNVNARDQPCRFCGSLITDGWGWVPSAGGIGVGVSLLGFMGKLNIGLIADTKQVPNLGTLARCFLDEWASMQAEVKQRLLSIKKQQPQPQPPKPTAA